MAAMTLATKPARRRTRVGLSNSFTPLFWVDCDGRCGTVKQIKKRLAALRQDANANSVQKEMLCQRAVFIALQLETMERQAAEGGVFDSGRYAQSCNALLGMLRALGLRSNRQGRRESLRDYVAEGGAA
jgi:hypothetical protein